MTTPTTEHLFEQAERLTKPLKRGPPRQVDLRRAISAAYYGLFHHILGALADEFVGRSLRSAPRYTLVYRSVDHRSLKALCAEVERPAPSRTYFDYAPQGGFGPELRVFAGLFSELQDRRNGADYNPWQRFLATEAVTAIVTARRAVERFAAADPEERATFLTLLLCPPRRGG